MTDDKNVHPEQDIPLTVIRPRFAVEMRYSVEEIIDLIIRGLNQGDFPVKGKIDHHHVLLSIDESEKHYWSPELSITFDEMETGNVIRGVFGPRPAVWTMFVFFYAMIGFGALVVLMVAMSYYTLDKSLDVLWLLPILVVIFLSLYLVAHSGKKMGKEHLRILHTFMEDSTGLKI